MLVYKITNLLNGKIYVGQTTREFEKRISEHQHNTTSCIGQAIHKYGWENFKAEIIEYCSSIQELNEREKFWIEKLNTKFPNGYNFGRAKFSEKSTRKIKTIGYIKGKSNTFAYRLLNLRKAAELSQAEVAKRLNINQPRYNRYEMGIFQPDMETLKKIAQLFDVSLDYLMENERTLSDAPELVDLNNFIISGRYTINSRVPTQKERQMLNNVISAIFAD